jgi:hypothetical protein
MRQGGLHMDDPDHAGRRHDPSYSAHAGRGAGCGALCLPRHAWRASVLSRACSPCWASTATGSTCFNWMLNPLMIRYVTPHVPGEALAHILCPSRRGTCFSSNLSSQFGAAWLSYTLFESRLPEAEGCLGPGLTPRLRERV